MKRTSHSEYDTLNKVMIKSANAAFVSDHKISEQWSTLGYLNKPQLNTANAEYTLFESVLRDCDVDISYLPENSSVGMDSIYCRDASIVTDYGVIICNMGKKERSLEPQVQKRFYEEHHIQILGEIIEPGTLEGGDVAWLDENTLAVGHTYRTNTAGISQLKDLLEPKGIEVLTVELPHYKGPSDVFHLMSIFSPVDAKIAVVYSPLMPIHFRNELLSKGYELVEVPEEEFDTMGCNVLALGPKKCLMLSGNPITEKGLVDLGCEVITYEGAHISVMGGGGPTCLTRPLSRTIF